MTKPATALLPPLNTEQAAELIGCAPYTLKRSRCDGELFARPAPVFRKMGRKVVYDADVIRQWIAAFPVKPNTAA
jgi:hypothetical protein